MGDVFLPDHRTEVEPSPRWVRVFFHGEVVADSREVLMVRETGRLPRYYFPKKDVRTEWLQPSDHREPGQPKGTEVFWHLAVGEGRSEDAASTFHDPPAGAPDLTGHLTFEWEKMDAWYEEDEEVFVHLRDPYKRIDVVGSSRHIRVALDGVDVAETRRPRLLFETGMPTRFYFPPADVNLGLLEKSTRTTGCPYKGEANYHSIRLGEKLYPDLVWYYRFPTLNCSAIAGQLCFFGEKMDIYDGGQLLERPKTPWS